MYRTSHRSPSVAVCFLVLSSLRTRDWRDWESVGEASWRSRTFWGGVSWRGGRGGFGRGGGGIVDLDVAEHVVLDGREGHGAELVWEGKYYRVGRQGVLHAYQRALSASPLPRGILQLLWHCRELRRREHRRRTCGLSGRKSCSLRVWLPSCGWMLANVLARYPRIKGTRGGGGGTSPQSKQGKQTR